MRREELANVKSPISRNFDQAERQPIPIEVLVEDERVSGEIVYFGPYDVAVRLIEPFGEMQLRSSTHVAIFARNAVLDGDRNRWATAEAEQILVDLFAVARHVSARQHELRAAWLRLVQNTVSPPIDSDQQLRRFVRNSRRRLRSGLISAQEHQKEIGRMQSKLRDSHTARRALAERFVSWELRRWAISLDVAEQVTKYLETAGG